MQRFTRVFALVFISLFVSAPLHAADDADAIAKIFRHKTLKADFLQQVFDQYGRLQQTLRGRLILQRPGKFRWSYQSPYEQEIVADGKKVWMYDVDLEQVTVKHQAQTVSGTPALLLSSRDEWRKDFDVAAIKRGDELQWYELTPKEKDGSFEHLYLATKSGQLARLEIADNFGQTTELIFSNLQTDVVINKDAFQFQAPDGVDVIDETAF